jgi:hypothetical protein
MILLEITDKIVLKVLDREEGTYEARCGDKVIGTIRFRNVPGEPGHYYIRLNDKPILADSLPKMRAAIKSHLSRQ